MKTRKPLAHEAFVTELLADPETRAAYEAVEPEYALLDELLRARAEAGLTQKEVARRMGTTQPVVARIEAADPRHSPTIRTLQRYAAAVGRHLEVRLVAAHEPRGRAAQAKRLTVPARQAAAGRRRSRGARPRV